MKQELIQKWTDALESKKYKQGRNTLKCNDKYCCLGVLADIVIKENNLLIDIQGECYLPEQVLEITDCFDQNRFANMNDIKGLSFKQIAKYIKKNGVGDREDDEFFM